MTHTFTIPLNQLRLWSGNVRRTGASDGIVELAASIEAHGLLQSLVVRDGKRGKYQVVAGQRRLLALSLLAKDRRIPKDHPVPCILANDAVPASELSLAENVMRAPMHPADQFEAFRALIDDGATIADVAARFSIPESTVAKRLKLGRLSPVILDAYRREEIDLEEAQAFAVTDDHAEQERVFADIEEWNRRPHTIRRALTADEVPTSDKRVRFVGLDVYEAAGGAVRRDLFSESDAGYIQDVALLDRLMMKKLRQAAVDLSGEGWLWLEIDPDAGYERLARFSRRYPERVDLPEAEQAELDRLCEAYDALASVDDADAAERLEELDRRIDELQSRAQAWSSEVRAIAGAIITIGHDGSLRVERGLVRKEDERLAKALDAASKNAPSAGDALSSRLVQDLTAQRSAALAAELMYRPDVALAAVVHSLLLDLFHPGNGQQSCIGLDLIHPGLGLFMAKPDNCKGLSALEAERARIGDRVPGNPSELWRWCLNRSCDELLALLAYTAARTVDAVQHKNERSDCARLVHADALAEAVGLDMTGWFVPDVEGYFSRVSRAQILAAIDEAKGSHGPALDKLKKAELAARAEQLIAGTGWLPAPLRTQAIADEQAADLPVAAE